MNIKKFSEAMNELDNKYVEKAINYQAKKRKPTWQKWIAVAASFALVLVVSIHFSNSNPTLGPGSDLPSDSKNPVSGFQMNVEKGIYVDGKLYMPNSALSKTATLENVGDAVGYVSIDNKTTSNIYAYEYIPEDGVTNKIIVQHNDVYFVYSFSSYISDGTENWPVDLLVKAASIEIRDPNYGVDNETIYEKITDVAAMVNFLSSLTEKHSQYELNEYYFAKFANHFNEGEIWINESGEIAHGGNAEVSTKFSELVSGKSRNIVVIMDDNTELLYGYHEGAGVIFCDNFGYILTEEQIELINCMIGLG